MTALGSQVMLIRRSPESARKVTFPVLFPQMDVACSVGGESNVGMLLYTNT